MLHVLINHYKEPEEIVARLLRSLAFQEVDWSKVKISMMTDGGLPLSKDFIDSFGIPIEYTIAPHRGVCATRNALMDSSEEEYVSFFDADDSFHSTLGLQKILKAIDDLRCDVIASPYDVEYPWGLVREKRDVGHVHGKAFRRGFLTENNIRFPDMPFSGDMAFLWLAFALADKSCWLMDSFYVWRHNPDSITRHNPNHRTDTYHMVLRNYELLYQDLIKRGRRDLQDALMGSVFAMMYFDHKSMGAISAMSDFASKYGDRYLDIPEDIRMVTFENARDSKGDYREVISWLNEI